MKAIPYELIERKLFDIVHEMARQKDAIEDHPEFATFQEQIEQIEDKGT
jgi:hypothetical protein